MQPSLILFPSSQKDSHLHHCIGDLQTQCLLVARKYFDETEGQRLVQDLMVRAAVAAEA